MRHEPMIKPKGAWLYGAIRVPRRVSSNSRKVRFKSQLPNTFSWSSDFALHGTTFQISSQTKSDWCAKHRAGADLQLKYDILCALTYLTEAVTRLYQRAYRRRHVKCSKPTSPDSGTHAIRLIFCQPRRSKQRLWDEHVLRRTRASGHFIRTERSSG